MLKTLRLLNQCIELDHKQLALAISLGIKLQKVENGLTLPSKIEDAEKTADSELSTTMQKALMQELGIDLDPKLTRGDLSYELMKWYTANGRKFFQSLKVPFQDRYCGGPLKRFDCLTSRLTTLKDTARQWAIVLSIAGVAYLAFKWFW